MGSLIAISAYDLCMDLRKGFFYSTGYENSSVSINFPLELISDEQRISSWERSETGISHSAVKDSSVLFSAGTC